MDIEDDEPPRIVQRSKKRPKASKEESTPVEDEVAEPPAEPSAFEVESDDTTRVVSREPTTTPSPPPDTTDPPVPAPAETQAEPPAQSEPDTAAVPDISAPDAAVVGWLVVVDGPGRGVSRALAAGVNHLGRDPRLRVCLNFGDPGISDVCQTEIIYEPKSRQFYIRKGHQTTKLTYLGEDGSRMVTDETQIKPGELITVGSTQLRFVAFCGPDFDWDGPPQKKPAKRKSAKK